MADWRLPLLRWAQARRERRATHTVLVLGDSHVRVFEHWWFLWALPRVRWHIEYVPGGTATGLPNPQSQTQAASRFLAALRSVPHDSVVLNLGEVDTGYTIWARAAREAQDAQAPQRLMQQAADRYIAFITELAAHHRLLVVSAPLPTLPDDFEPANAVGTTRKALPHTQAERTALTLAFNDRVAAACAALGVPYLDDRAASLGPDGLVSPAWQRRDRADHHYHRGTYARWLARALKPHLRTLAPAP